MRYMIIRQLKKNSCESRSVVLKKKTACICLIECQVETGSNPSLSKFFYLNGKQDTRKDSYIQEGNRVINFWTQRVDREFALRNILGSRFDQTTCHGREWRRLDLLVIIFLAVVSKYYNIVFIVNISAF